jgi:phage terminase small subunit
VQLKTYIRELGLSPSARTGLPAGPGDDDEDEDDIFD